MNLLDEKISEYCINYNLNFNYFIRGTNCNIECIIKKKTNVKRLKLIII